MIVAASVLGMTGSGRLDHNRVSIRSRLVLKVVVRVMRAMFIHSAVLLSRFHDEVAARHRQQTVCAAAPCPSKREDIA